MILSCIFIASLCILLIEILERVAPATGLVDRPTERKSHEGEIPVVGGIAIFMAWSAASIILPELATIPTTLLIASGILVLLGVLDDILSLSAILRLIAQITIAAATVHFGDIRIESIGAIIGVEQIEMTGITSTIFTILCIVGVINAINMIDGLDGLAGSILLISFGALTILAIKSQSPHAIGVASISTGLAVFLWYNNRIVRPRARIFLGDSGSMFLGLALVWYLVQLSQEASTVQALTAVSAGWIFGLPLLETISVMVARMVQKKSPFLAGRDHLHHRLLGAGLNHNKVLLCMVSAHLILVLIGLSFAGEQSAEPYLFWSFVIVTLVYFLGCRNLAGSGKEIAARW